MVSHIVVPLYEATFVISQKMGDAIRALGGCPHEFAKRRLINLATDVLGSVPEYYEFDPPSNRFGATIRVSVRDIPDSERFRAFFRVPAVNRQCLLPTRRTCTTTTTR